MDIASIIGIMLFILPGILAEKISYRMDYPASESRSEFREVINGLILSLPIISFVGIIFSLFWGLCSLNMFISAFDDWLFLLLFTAAVLVLAIIVGVAKGLTKDFWIDKVNRIRKHFKKMSIDDKSCWRKVFLEDIYNDEEDERNKYPKYIIIELNKKTYEGFALCYSLPNEEIAVALEKPENMVGYPDFKEYLSSEKIYVNIEKGIIIKSYDTKKLNEYINKHKDNPNS